MKTNILHLAGVALAISTSTALMSFTNHLNAEKKLESFNKADLVKNAKSAAKFENVLFEFDKATIKEDSYSELNKLAETMIANKQGLSLGGHADAVGEYVYNWHLSKKRADAVKEYLVSKGVDKSRVAATEFGDTKPLATNDTEEGRQQNRRVELQLL
jgi:outer membrane protein OmpA-like peptidoglycan-associated protein